MKEGSGVKVYTMVEIRSVFHGCEREKSKEVSTRVETLDLEQSDEIGNIWLGDAGLEGVNSEDWEWAHIERNLRIKGSKTNSNSPSYFSERQKFCKDVI